jgi:SAM-dependent methyltransferase
MMRPDIADLTAFYASPCGRLAQRLIERRLDALRPRATGLNVLGLGFAGPFLETFVAEAERVVALMPHEQGSVAWPEHDGNRAAVVQETMLPLADQSVDVAVLVHAIEATDRVHRLLREVWRVLHDHGRLLVIVPNRRGLWCLAERTPFGQGRPYSASQLQSILESNLFSPLRRERALYVPPFQSPLWLKTAPLWERTASRVARQLGGVILVEAEKSMIAGSAVLADNMRRAPRVYALPARSAAAREAEAVPREEAATRAIAFTEQRRRD